MKTTRRWMRGFQAVLAGMSLLLLSALAFGAFPDAKPPPDGWTGTTFKLSQSYPATLPTSSADTVHPWTAFDFKVPADAPKYMNAVLNYCLQGNAKSSAPSKAFAYIAQNSVRKWYHAPWLQAGTGGREFMHGLTQERGSRATAAGGDLGVKQKHPYTNWAVGFYNPLGGYTIGQVWKDELHPDATKAIFPEHTVTCKLLFTETPAKENDLDLTGSLRWRADIKRSSSLKESDRPFVRLLQIDIAIKDSRSPIGWVFGTFQYQHNASTSSLWWKHMVPVGLMWGNDVTHIKQNQPSQEQWINPARIDSIHLGFRGLLNGPIDNPQASCVACHGFAQVEKPNVSSPHPTLPGNNTWSAGLSAQQITDLFTNVPAATAISGDYVSVDYSLQLLRGIAARLNASSAAPSGAPLPAAAPGAPPAHKVQDIER